RPPDRVPSRRHGRARPSRRPDPDRRYPRPGHLSPRRRPHPDPPPAGPAWPGPMSATHPAIAFSVNGQPAAVATAPIRRLADVLREELGLTGTKIGCNAGDCGACTVLLDGEQVCACLVPVGQVAGREVTTVEGLAAGELSLLQRAFHQCGAAQCGI